MTTFYICRHGQTENNKHRRLMGWIDTPLTEAGLQNAQSSAAKLRGIHLDQIVSSDLGRAFTSSYIISRANGFTDEIMRFSELREVNYGDWANTSHDDPKLSALSDTSFAPPNGESVIQMQARVIACLSDLSAKNADKTILVVAHDGTINAVRAYFQRGGFNPEDDIFNPHDFVGRFVIDNGKITSFEELLKVPA